MAEEGSSLELSGLPVFISEGLTEYGHVRDLGRPCEHPDGSESSTDLFFFRALARLNFYGGHIGQEDVGIEGSHYVVAGPVSRALYLQVQSFRRACRISWRREEHLYVLAGNIICYTHAYSLLQELRTGLDANIIDLFCSLTIRSLEHIWRLHQLWNHQRTYWSYSGVALVKRRKVQATPRTSRFHMDWIFRKQCL